MWNRNLQIAPPFNTSDLDIVATRINDLARHNGFDTPIEPDENDLPALREYDKIMEGIHRTRIEWQQWSYTISMTSSYFICVREYLSSEELDANGLIIGYETVRRGVQRLKADLDPVRDAGAGGNRGVVHNIQELFTFKLPCEEYCRAQYEKQIADLTTIAEKF